MSSVASQFLFRDLELNIPSYHHNDALEKMLSTFEAVTMCDGLKFVKTLKVGPIEGKMIELFDRLISRLQDHSLVNFEWDAGAPPLNSQLAYIWGHQSNIRSIDLIDVTDAVKAVQPWKDLKFPQKYENISLNTPLEEDFVAKLDLSCMRTLTVEWIDFEELPSSISDHMIHITNLKLHSITFFGVGFELDQIASLVSLGLYGCDDTALVLSNFKNPKLKEFHIECDWDEIEEEMLEEDFDWDDNEDFVAQFSFIRGFQGLETLVIAMPDRRHPASLLKNLTDSISLEHNDTLRRLALLDACNPIKGGKYTFGTTESRNSVYDAVMVCPHLVDLELPTEWKTKELDFKVCVFYI